MTQRLNEEWFDSLLRRPTKDEHIGSAKKESKFLNTIYRQMVVETNDPQNPKAAWDSMEAGKRYAGYMTAHEGSTDEQYDLEGDEDVPAPFYVHELRTITKFITRLLQKPNWGAKFATRQFGIKSSKLGWLSAEFNRAGHEGLADACNELSKDLNSYGVVPEDPDFENRIFQRIELIRAILNGYGLTL